MKKYKLSPANGGFFGRFAARMMFQRDDFKKENERLRKALKYYADKNHYEPYGIANKNNFACDITEDEGYIARQALEGVMFDDNIR